MTRPSALKLLLIFLASSSVCPVAPVLPIFSDPARSTRKSEPVFWVPVSVLRAWTVMTKIECERDDSAFIPASSGWFVVRKQRRESAGARSERGRTGRSDGARRSTLAHDLVHLVRVADVEVGQVFDVDAALLVLVHGQVVVLGCGQLSRVSSETSAAVATAGRNERRTGEQVTDALHVDLHVRHLDEVLEVGRRRHDGREDLLGDARNDALQLRVVDAWALRARREGQRGDVERCRSVYSPDAPAADRSTAGNACASPPRFERDERTIIV